MKASESTEAQTSQKEKALKDIAPKNLLGYFLDNHS